ncbi:MAG: membrane protease subunit HflK [Pirellulaceae bacterium]|jgi:membrane protease subunit HflK
MARIRERVPTRDNDPKALLWLIPVGLTLFLIVILALGSFYTVDAHQQAVVMRFGKVLATTGPGLNFKIPIVDTAVLVDIDEKSLALPYGAKAATRGNGDMQTRREKAPEPLILTGDLYAGVVEWSVNWRVDDPQKYLFSIDQRDVEATIVGVARSVMHRVVGDYSADEILTGKREEIGIQALNEMQQVLESYDCGVRIVALQMQRVTPPLIVKKAFDEVNASIQQKEQLVNEAQKERNRLIPQAEAQAITLERQALGYAARRRAEADGEISALLAKYEAYQLAPDVTRKRLYLEAMEQVMKNSGPKTVLDANMKGLLPLLDLSK